MTIRKNWFIYLTLILFEICALYALFSIVTDMARGKPYSFIWYGGIICFLAAATVFVHVALKLTTRLNLAIIKSAKERKSIFVERIIVGSVLLVSAALRIWALTKLPITPSSDYQTYFQVADLLSKGTLSSSGYSGYIAEFPHVIGYPFVLSLLFRITGPSLLAGLSVNLMASLACVYLTYRIARTLCGRLGGIAALCAAAFWPSQILYGTILASEPVFTCILLLTIRLFIFFFRYPAILENREGAMFLCIALGVLTALAAAIRPLSQILLIAILLCMFPFIVRFNNNEKMLNGKLIRAS